MTATPLLAPAHGRRSRLLGPAVIAATVVVLAGATALKVVDANEPVLTATLNAPPEAGGGPLFRARVEPRRKRVTLAPLQPKPHARQARVRELWLAPAEGGLPHAAGLIDPNRTSPLEMNSTVLKEAKPKARLTVSLEPKGGSPTGLPTGPMIAEGRLSGD